MDTHMRRAHAHTVTSLIELPVTPDQLRFTHLGEVFRRATIIHSTIMFKAANSSVFVTVWATEQKRFSFK